MVDQAATRGWWRKLFDAPARRRRAAIQFVAGKGPIAGPSWIQRIRPVLLLVLDGVTDPHNLGACLRSADAAGVDAVIVPRDNAADLTPAVRKVACGAAEVVPFVPSPISARPCEALKERGVWLFGAAGEAENSIYDNDLTGSVALVMGAEGRRSAAADPGALRPSGAPAHGGIGEQPERLCGHRYRACLRRCASGSE